MKCPSTWHSELSADDSNDSFIVLGVLHSTTGFAKYASIAAYDWPKLAPVGDSSDIQLLNSAAFYLGDRNPATKNLYAVKFSRKCPQDDSGELCLVIPAYSDKPSESSLSYGSPVIFIERSYLNPATKSGPSVEETILPVLLHTRTKQDGNFEML